MPHKTINKIGFSAGLIAFAATTAFVIVQLLQILAITSFPLGEILIYGTSLCIVIPFIIAILALHYITPEEKKFWTHGALIFTIFYAVCVSTNYVVQLATVIPMKLKGEGDAIRILDQTPHSLFWDFDALGYIFMGIAMLMAVPSFKKNGFHKWVRVSFLANAAVTPLIAIVYFYPYFSGNLLILGFPWAITAPIAMLLLAIIFRKNSKTTQSSNREWVIYALGILLLFLAINAFAGGYYGMTLAKNIPIEWLNGSPFTSYFYPSLILFTCVGGSALLAAILIFKKHKISQKAAFSSGVILLGWIFIQLLIIGYVSWMQPAVAIAGIVVLLLASQLPSPEN